MAECPECKRECEHIENGIHIYNNEPKCCICQKTNNAFIVCFTCDPLIDWNHFRTTREFKLKETSQIAKHLPFEPKKTPEPEIYIIPSIYKNIGVIVVILVLILYGLLAVLFIFYFLNFLIQIS